MPGTLHTTEYYAARRQITEKNDRSSKIYTSEIYLQVHYFLPTFVQNNQPFTDSKPNLPC